MASSMAPRPDCQNVSKPPPPIASSNGTQQWPAIGIHQWHPAMAPHHMAPSNGTLPWHPASSNGTQHLTTPPSNGATSSLSKCHNHPPLIASSNGTWHPAMAPDHGTQQWHHVQSVKVCHNQKWHLTTRHPATAMAPNNDTHHGILPSHLTMAPSNGTTSNLSPPIASSNGTQQWNLTTLHPAAPYHGP